MNTININERQIAIAANLLYRNGGSGLKIQSINFDLCHLLVTADDEIKTRFGVVLMEKGMLGTNIYQEYVATLKRSYFGRSNPDNFPILLMELDTVNESAMIGMQLGWLSGERVVVYEPVTLKPMSGEWFNTLYQISKAMNSTITMLSVEYFSFLRSIDLKGKRENGYNFDGKILYARAIMPHYKEQSLETSNNFEVNDINLYFEGPQYKEDELDHYIMEMVNEHLGVFCNINKEQDKLMLFSSDVKELQLYSKTIGGYDKYKMQYLMTPLIGDPIYEMYITPIILNKLTLFIRGAIDVNIIPILTSFRKTIDVNINDWREKTIELNNKLDTFVNVYDIIVS